MAVISIKDMPRNEATEKFFQMAALDLGGRDDELSLQEVLASLSTSETPAMQERAKELYETVQFLTTPTEVEVYQDGKKIPVSVSGETTLDVYSKNPDVPLARLKSLIRYRVQQNTSNDLLATRISEVRSDAINRGGIRYVFGGGLGAVLGFMGATITTGGTFLFGAGIAAFVFGVMNGAATIQEQFSNDINKEAAKKVLGKQS